MTKKEYSNFKQWYDLKKQQTYNLKMESELYCKNDSLIALTAFMSFKEMYKQQTNINPITRNFTLASIAMETFRAKFLRDKQIGITPIGNYSQRMSSIVGMVWLDLEEYTRNKEIKREYKIGKYYADGCIKEEKLVFEFWGCYYHGCINCYTGSERNNVSVNGKTYEHIN